MTNDNSTESRLDNIERILQGVTESIQLLAAENRATRAITESNARAIQALTNHTAEARDDAEEERSEIRLAINTMRETVAELVQASRENIAQHMEFRERFDRIQPPNQGV